MGMLKRIVAALAIGRLFERHARHFHLYALYNKNKPKSDLVMAECGGIFFRTKQLALHDKLDLHAYLLQVAYLLLNRVFRQQIVNLEFRLTKSELCTLLLEECKGKNTLQPVQRMGKYALFLSQLLKLANDEARESLHRAEKIVSTQLRHGNDLLAMDLIRGCGDILKVSTRSLPLPLRRGNSMTRMRICCRNKGHSYGKTTSTFLTESSSAQRLRNDACFSSRKRCAKLERELLSNEFSSSDHHD